MPDALKTILLIFFVIGGLFFALRITGWKMKKACEFIIRDLREKKAFDQASAVKLPYAKGPMINIGLRDYRPRALDVLMKQDVVRMMEGDVYYLREGYKLE
ncbi:MAG: hypothetical protein ABFC95_06710, partial [Smithella sp.]